MEDKITRNPICRTAALHPGRAVDPRPRCRARRVFYGARALCGQIAHKGYPVIMYEPLAQTADYLKLKAAPEFWLDGDITVGGKSVDEIIELAS